MSYGHFASPGGGGGSGGTSGGLLASPRHGSGHGLATSGSLLLLPPSAAQGQGQGQAGQSSGVGLDQLLLSQLHHQQQQQQRQQPQAQARQAQPLEVDIPTWRLKERMKTVGVGMILALNVGTDPPDCHKPNPCAKLQCWIDPTTMSRAKARERIGERLEAQYARWQQRAKLRYKRALDPTVEDVRSLCASMRRQAKNDRLLLHYNGHGVPRPTADGEFYVFDKNHTHFIPLSVLDLRRWIDKPTIVVLDCSGAGVLVPYLTGALDHQLLLAQQQGGVGVGVGVGVGGGSQQQQYQSSPSISAMASPTRQQQQHSQQRRPFGNAADAMNAAAAAAGAAAAGGIGRMAGETEAAYAARTVRDVIVLCPTSPGDLLPMGPEFPADLFTSCLTTPIPIALRWFVHRNPLSRASIDPERVDSIPGKINDRKTPLGELNWIFTAITDTIAWQVLPSPLFQRLFRQDLIVASMFRNFLLADRILRTLNCTPMSHPALPTTHDHPLWLSWDLAVETCLDQLMKEGVLVDQAAEKRSVATAASTDSEGVGSSGEAGSNGGIGNDSITQGQIRPSHPASLAPAAAASTESPPLSSQPRAQITAPFFAEQLTAFEIWLEFASLRLQGGEEGQVLQFGDPLTSGDVSGRYFYLEPPEQLPVVLQVLLSQAHRVRALALLRRFLDLGNAAVNLALSVGIFPYVLKLLQSSIDEYKHVLVGIWAKILLFDSSCQADLVKDGALPHFIRHLHWGLPDSGAAASSNLPNPLPLPATMGDDGAGQRTMAAVILSSICSDYAPGQKECFAKNLHGFCSSLLSSVEYLSTVEGSVSTQPGAKRASISEERVPASFRLWL